MNGPRLNAAADEYMFQNFYSWYAEFRIQPEAGVTGRTDRAMEFPAEQRLSSNAVLG
jgi:hypothetical protein